MLRVKLLESGARLPVVAHPGEDLGYDLFALAAVTLAPRSTAKVRTGIAVEARHPETGAPLGLLVRDRSSMAARGIATTGGVIDAGEAPLAAGVRELAEETGFTGTAARLLGSVHPNPAMQNNRCHFVFVEGARRTAPLDWDEDEELQTLTLPVDEVLAMAHNGGITHGLVMNALMLFEPVWRALPR